MVVVRPHVLTLECSFTSHGSWFDRTMTATSGWRIVDINNAVHPASFDPLTETCLQKEDVFLAAKAEAEADKSSDDEEEEKGSDKAAKATRSSRRNRGGSP